MNIESKRLGTQITSIGIITIIFIAITSCLLLIRVREVKDSMEKLGGNTDYQIKLNPDNSIQLISKDTIRKIDFFDLEEIIMQDNI